MSAETKTTPIPGLSPTKCNVVVISTANAEPSVLASNVECPQTSTSAAGTGGSNTVQIQTGTTPLAGQTTNTTPSQQPTTVTNNATGGNVHPVASSGITSSIQAATESSVATTSAAFTIEISKPTLLPINGTLNNTLVVPHSDAQKGLTGGAVAGVAIGMLLAGVIIAGAVFLVLLRRQKKQQAISAAAYSRQHAPYNDRSVRPEKGPTVVAAPVGSIENLLPQPAEDDAITGQLSKIRDNIKNHVRTYYHSGPITSADLNDASIRDVAALTGSSPAILVNALSNPSTRDNALRAIVGSVILTRCTGERTPSLLPTELAAISATIQVDSGNNRKSASPIQRLPTHLWRSSVSLDQQVEGSYWSLAAAAVW